MGGERQERCLPDAYTHTRTHTQSAPTACIRSVCVCACVYVPPNSTQRLGVVSPSAPHSHLSLTTSNPPHISLIVQRCSGVSGVHGVKGILESSGRGVRSARSQAPVTGESTLGNEALAACNNPLSLTIVPIFAGALVGRDMEGRKRFTALTSCASSAAPSDLA